MATDLLPFVVQAIGHNKRIYKDIDKMYQKNKYEYYKAAKKHKLYNHIAIKEGSLLQEEYCKKVLGILVGNKDDEWVKDFDKLLKKGFEYTYTYVENHRRIDLEEFARAFMKKYKGEKDKYGVPIEHHVVILLFLAINDNDKEIVKNETHDKYLHLLNMLWEHSNHNETRISLNKLTIEEKKEIKELKQAIYNEYGEIRNFDDIVIKRLDLEGLDLCGFLFDYEDLSSFSIFDEVKFTDKDIDEILYLFILNKEDLSDIKNITKLFISYMYIKYMIKAYKKVKETYFKNNKETMYIEIEELEKSLNTATQKLFAQKQELNKLQQQLEKLERENKRLKTELEEERKNRNELIGLREFMFSLDRQEEYNIKEEIDMEFLRNYKSVIIGGHEKWQQRMKELLPNFIFIHPDQTNFDTKILENIDIIFIYVNYLNHGIYYKVMSAIEGKNIKVAYLNQQNEDKVLQEIYQKIKKPHP